MFASQPTCRFNCELGECMHGSMQLDVALGAMHHAFSGCCRHVDPICQARHLLRPIPADHQTQWCCCCLLFLCVVHMHLQPELLCNHSVKFRQACHLLRPTPACPSRCFSVVLIIVDVHEHSSTRESNTQCIPVKPNQFGPPLWAVGCCACPHVAAWS